MAATSLVVGLIVLFLQISPPVPVPKPEPPVPQPSSSQAQTQGGGGSTTMVFPPPDPEVVAETEKQAAPTILRSFASDGAQNIGQVFKLGLQLGRIRKDLIQSQVVQDINSGMQRFVLLTIALVIAALAVWGLIGAVFGSDGTEAFEALGRVPLWTILALTSWQWFGTMLDAFAALGGLIASSSDGAFGPVLQADFWANLELGAFSLLIGLFMLLVILFFALQLLTNTAFLGFAAAVAPAFVFLKTTPWTDRWGSNWFRMVPGTAADLLAMLTLLVIGAAGMSRIGLEDNPFGVMAFDLGLLFTLPLIRRLFGLEGNSVGSRLVGALLIARLLRNMRGGSAGAAGTAGSTAAAGASAAASSSSPTQPTRAPRWAAQGRAGTAVTSKLGGETS